MFELFKYLHILTIIAAVAAAMIPELVLHAIARQGDVASLRGFVKVAEPVGKAVPILFVVAALLGFGAVFTGSFDPLRPWLLASYVVFVIAMAVGGLMTAPWSKRVAEAAFASPVDTPSQQLRAAIHDPRGMISTVILLSAIAVLVFLMVVKPGA